MYIYHIKGYTGIGKNDYCYNNDDPVDITVCATGMDEAIEKAEKLLGKHISTSHRKVTIREIIEHDVVYTCDGKACTPCQERGPFRYCYHTSDIKHAVNFEEVAPGKYAERR